EELAILTPFRGKIPEEVFTVEYNPPKTDGSGNIRENLRVAVRLLSEAVWERIALPFTKNLERLGVTARVRTIDSAQYRRRVDDFDFDVIVSGFPQSL